MTTTNTPTRTALVLGATGGIGGETAAALARRGWRVRALVRDPNTRAATALRAEQPSWDLVAGDAMDGTAVARAAEGVEVIVHAVNPPGYRNWGALVLPMLDYTIAAARASGARVLLPGAIYNYGPDVIGPGLTGVLEEDAPQHPVTRKGLFRVEMERRLEAAAAPEDGRAPVRSLVVRFGDFFGPRAGNSWFSQGMVAPGRPVARVVAPAARGVGHAWAYLPDAGEAFTQLAERETELPAFARFHFAGHWDADGRGVAGAIVRAARAAGGRAVRVWQFPWALLRLAAPFNETMRELLEMHPLWQAPGRLDNRRLVALLGAEPHTPLDDAVAATLRGLGCLPA